MRSRTFQLAILGFSALVVFLTQLGNPLAGGHSDEPLYIGIATEMMHRHEWIIPYFHGAVAFYKPPFLYWMIILSFKAFGTSLFAARLPAALCGALLAVVTALLGETLFGKKGELAGWLTATTIPGVYAYARASLMDIPLVLFITLALYCAVLAARKRSAGFLGLSFVFMGLSSLLKGPIGLLIPLIPFVWYCYREWLWNLLPKKQALFGLFCCLVLFFFWPIAVIVKGYGQSWLHFFIFQENFGKFSQSLDPTTKATPASVIWIHLMSQFLPWTFFLLTAAFIFSILKRTRITERWFLMIWILTVAFVFLIPEKKLSHYTLPAIPPSALLVSGYLLEFEAGWLPKLPYYLTGIIFAVTGILLLMLTRVVGGLWNEAIALAAAVPFLYGAFKLFKRKLEPAAHALMLFLFLFALGLPGLMSGLDLNRLQPLLDHHPIYGYDLDLGILSRATQREIVEVKDPKILSTTHGLLILPKEDRVDFLKAGLELSSPLLVWDSWKDHIRLLDILQAVISGKPALIHRTVILVKI